MKKLLRRFLSKVFAEPRSGDGGGTSNPGPGGSSGTVFHPGGAL